jgi:hypothetical protein
VPHECLFVLSVSVLFVLSSLISLKPEIWEHGYSCLYIAAEKTFGSDTRVFVLTTLDTFLGCGKAKTESIVLLAKTDKQEKRTVL